MSTVNLMWNSMTGLHAHEANCWVSLKQTMLWIQ